MPGATTLTTDEPAFTQFVIPSEVEGSLELRLAGTNDETIFCVWGARASRMLVVVSRHNELLRSILCHRRRGERSRTHYTDLETRSFANSLAAYPRDFALITRPARCWRQLP